MNEAPPARRADSRRNRRRLIEAAAAVIERDGAQASLEEIARRAGVGSATLHRHFPSRHALLNAVFHEGVERLSRRAGELVDTVAPREALTTWLDELTIYTTTTCGLSTALFSGPDGEAPEENSCHGLMNHATASLVSNAMAAGVLRTEVTPRELIVLTNAISLAAEGDPGSARRLLELALGGVLASPSAAHRE
ncbi:TetR/AcrR family transcriptional regulator [Actinoalloteichus fjordicus]|uniref:Transcriptional regulator, TetR family n=1 Tax=Actinoalloteichus fjordicus TaxID=1612552 RepID=A0AAC9L974_9PSEU|nr:helix-turn-helix domain-containing protein [Actinoalloteichus fjordicus]APU13151.1 transcriptional regulator, TetR family [Actinoalloteichus fjordicus]